MTSGIEFDKAFRKEFPKILTNLIFPNEDGSFEIFGRYVIKKEKAVYHVYCSGTDMGMFSGTKTALSWCIASKFANYNLARDILILDNKLRSLSNDITTRVSVAERSKNSLFRETVETKLETKIIHKKQVEQQLNKCVNYAKRSQTLGFNTEQFKKK
jgi:hypothetical protein